MLQTWMGTDLDPGLDYKWIGFLAALMQGHDCMQHGKPVRCGRAELACLVLGVGNDMQHLAALAIAT